MARESEDKLVAFLGRKRERESVEVKFVNINDENNSLPVPTGAGIKKWRKLAAALRAARAVTVELFDRSGKFVDAYSLEDDETGDDEGTVKERYEAKMLTRDHQALAAILDRYGDRLNEAFDRGADAANVSQQNLVELVQFLTQSLANALVAYTKTAQQLAALTAGEEPSNQNDAMVGQVIGAAVQKFMGSGDSPPNGKAKGKER